MRLLVYLMFLYKPEWCSRPEHFTYLEGRCKLKDADQVILVYGCFVDSEFEESQWAG